MQRIYEVSAGIDVHRDSNVVSVRRQSKGSDDDIVTRTFETFHDSLCDMAQWLTDCGVQVIGVESTGDYWKPTVRILQERCKHAVLWLVNPVQVKKVPGRKTDKADSRWLSKLVMYGLISPSFLPSPEQEDLRKLTRLRAKVVTDQTRYKNRVVKHVESSGVKLASVCADVLGKTSRSILEAMLGGVTDPDELADLACGSLRNKRDEIKRAVQGTMSPATQFALREVLDQLDQAQKLLKRIDEQIAQRLKPLAREMALLKTIDGVDDVVAATVLAECGADMSVFPSQHNLTSWGGFSPGSNESAGKAKHAPARKGDKYLRTILVQAANGAVKAKGSWWKAKFSQLIARLGHNKAIFAIGRKMLIAIFHILRDRVPYRCPEPAQPSPAKLARMVKNYTNKLQELGFEVSVSPVRA